ncbi:MAG: LamG-like jellyroll fold domain-containing protein [Nanoarchaeota archaeon]|nr:LamG-like jellyroll fold domain-containing protein [Nanoarchaeota archaeon]
MKKNINNKGKKAGIKFIVVFLVIMIFIVIGLIVFNLFGIKNTTQKQDKDHGLESNVTGLFNIRTNPINEKRGIPSQSFKEKSISSILNYVNKRSDIIGNVIATDYKVSTEENKQREKGFDSAVASKLMDENIIVSYNKIIKNYPTRIEFKTGFDLESNPSITGNVIGSQEINDIKEQAMSFFDKYSSVLGVNKDELKEKNIFKVGNSEYISFEQMYKGIPVYLSQTLLVESNDKWLLYNSNYLNDINIDVNPKINEKQAIESAKTYNSITKEPVKSELLIYPFIDKRGIENYLAYKIDFPVLFFSNGTVISPSIFVNANNGNIIDIIDNIKIETASGRVYGSIINDHLGNPLEIKDFANENISSGVYNTITDQNGNYSLDIGNNNEITSELKGPYVIVDNKAQAKASSRITIPPYQTDINWSLYDNSYKKEESNVFYHTNRIHDFFAKGDAPFNINGLDYQMEANVEVSGTCNAFATGDSINFYQPGGGCEALSLSSDVIYHEYTHNVVFILAPRLSSVYSGHTGNMNEGYADYYACSLNNQTCLSDNFVYDYSCLRNCENTKKFPEDYGNEPHYAAEIISGSLWDTRKLIGQEKTDTLALVALSYDPQTFQELAGDMMIADDAVYGNANLNDGSPNKGAICNSFINHGITSIDCADVVPLLGELKLKNHYDKALLNITGSALGKDFYNYTLYYSSRNSPDNWNYMYSSNKSVRNDVLYSNFNLSMLDDPYYTIKLVLSTSNGITFTTYKGIFIGQAFDFPTDAYFGTLGANKIAKLDGDKYSLLFHRFGWSTDILRSYSMSNGSVNFNKDKYWIYSFPVISDLNNDGKKEIIFKYSIPYGKCQAQILDFNGNQIYNISLKEDCVWDYVSSTTVSDIDNDGNKEILIDNGLYSNNGSLINYYNNLRTSWKDEYASGKNPILADINNDGKKELISSGIYVYDINGSLLRTYITAPYDNVQNMIVGDINLDGIKEIITFSQSTMYNNAINIINPVKNELIIQSTTNIPDECSPMLLSDVNGDKFPEIICYDIYSSDISIFNNTGNLINKITTHSSSHFYYMNFPISEDINGDGINEIIFGGDKIYFYNWDGSYAREPIHLSQSGDLLFPIVGDFNEDGKTDVVAFNNEEGLIYIINLNSPYKNSDTSWPYFFYDLENSRCYRCNENITIPMPSRPQSKLVNNDTNSINGNLKIILQKNISNIWQDIRTVTNKQVTIPANGLLKLDTGKDNLGSQVFEGFNNLNVVATSAGDYRIYLRFERSGQVVGDSWEFKVRDINKNLKAYWNFDENSGNITVDKIQGIEGNIIGADWTNGINNGALKFKGDSTSYASLNTGDKLITGEEITISFWFNSSGGFYMNRLMQKNTEWAFGTQSYGTDSIYFQLSYIYKGKNNTGAVSCSKPYKSIINNETWHFVTVTYSEKNGFGNLIMYLDGEQCGWYFLPKNHIIRVGDNSMYFGKSNRYLGYSWPIDYFNGTLDEVRIYNISLTPEEVQGIYKQSI